MMRVLIVKYRTFSKEVGFKKYLRGISDEVGFSVQLLTHIGMERGKGIYTVPDCTTM